MDYCHEITHNQYQEYKNNWYQAVPEDATPFPAKYFRVNGEENGAWIYGYQIDTNFFDKLRHGFLKKVTRIIFSFVMDDKNTIQIVLFGTNDTSYHAVTPYYMLDKPILTCLTVGQEISTKEALKWTGVWADFELKNESELPSYLLQVSDIDTSIQDVRLQSHIYTIPDMTDDKMDSLNAYFAVHDYSASGSIAGNNLLTFVIQHHYDTDSRDDTFYDVSHPCPPCCPGCP